jgi:ATP-dependent DNA helicase RecG
MNLIYEFCVKEAKLLPDFRGTDANFVCLTLNGIVIDERMLLLIKRIGDERLESLSTDDFLAINALFHEQKLPVNLRSCVRRLVDMGIIERLGRGKFVLARWIYKTVGKSGTHTRLKVLDRETNKLSC